MINRKKTGFTLLELLISIGILAFIGVAVANLFSSAIKVRTVLSERSQTIRQLHIAMGRIVNDLSHAMLFVDTAKVKKARKNKAVFVVREESDYSDLNFVINNKERYFAGTHVSDLAEVGYFVKSDSALGKFKHLYRRESSVVNEIYDKGGLVYKLLDHIAIFKVKFNSGKDADFDLSSWDTNKSDNKDTLPKGAEITLGIYRDVESDDEDLSEKKIAKLTTKVLFEQVRD